MIKILATTAYYDVCLLWKNSCLRISFTEGLLLGSKPRHLSSKSASAATVFLSSAPAFELNKIFFKSFAGWEISISLIILFPETGSVSKNLNFKDSSKWGSICRDSYDLKWARKILLLNLPLMSMCNFSISLLDLPGNMTCPVNNSYRQVATDHRSTIRSSESGGKIEWIIFR